MKIAFTAKGKDWEAKVDPRFGRTAFILLYDDETQEMSHFDNQDVENEAHGAGSKTSQKLYEMGADVLITGNGPGGTAATILNKTDVKIYVGAGDMTIAEAYEAYKRNELKSA